VSGGGGDTGGVVPPVSPPGGMPTIGGTTPIMSGPPLSWTPSYRSPEGYYLKTGQLERAG
jgi:hypothetical protein